MLNIPLMENNINEDDKKALIDFIEHSDHFTNGKKVKEFESEWSKWLGWEGDSLFVNSGSSANYITMAAIRELYGEGEVIISPIGWTSDIASIITAGHTPVFVDVNMANLSINAAQIEEKITDKTRAVVVIHVLGFNGLSEQIVDICKRHNVLLIEDTCESHGATFNGQKCGSIGDITNFSFYYAHHMSTIEGGMICTKNKELSRMMRMMRSHGLLRECADNDYINIVKESHADLHEEFIFPIMGYNMRSTELNAVIGLNQLKRLDENVRKRRENYNLFISNLDSRKYYTDFDNEGNSNYAFVVMPRPDRRDIYNSMIEAFRREMVEFRRGTAGGGNMTRQPYIRERYPDINPADYPNAEYIHENGVYIGNYPDLDHKKIQQLCEVLNSL